MISISVDLLRHGACVDGQIYRGRTDSSLSEVGISQMAAAVHEQNWDAIFCSPLQRCHSFAQSLSKQLQIPLISDPRLIEFDFGEWDGQSIEGVWQQHQQEVLAFWDDPISNPPPDAEPLIDMQARIVGFLDELCQYQNSQRVLVITHGGVIRIALSHLLKLPLRASQQLSVDYGSISRVEFYLDDEAHNDESQHWVSQVIFTNRLIKVADYRGD